MVLILKNLVVK